MSNYPLNIPLEIAPNNYGGEVPEVIYSAVSTLARINNPQNIATDGNGNLYVPDMDTHVIRQISPAGDISIFAGIAGTAGNADGPITSATFNGPAAVVFDSQGNMFVSDNLGHRIRKISPDGTVSTFAGDGNPGYIAGISTTARFKNPYGLVTDELDNLYVADMGNNAIRKISPSGNVLNLAANTNLAAPQYITKDDFGTLYVSSGNNNVIRKVTPMGSISVYVGLAAGSLPGLQNIDRPGGLMMVHGELFFTGRTTHKLYKIKTDGSLVTIAGSGTAGNTNAVGVLAQFNAPRAIVIGVDGNLYLTDNGNGAIRQVMLTGYTTDATLPPGITFNPLNGKFSGTPTKGSPLTDYTVYAYNAGGVSSTVVSIGVEPEPLSNKPLITYTSPQTYKVGISIPQLAPTNTGGSVPATIYGETKKISTTGLNFGMYVAADIYGDVYVSEYGGNRIAKIGSPENEIIAGSTGGSSGKLDGPADKATFSRPRGIVASPSGTLYVAEEANNRVRVIANSGSRYVSTLAGNDATTHTDGYGANASFLEMNDLGIDPTGNILYVADRGHNAIRKINLQTDEVTTLPANALQRPSSVDADAAGNVYIGDTGNNLIKKVSAAGVANIGSGFSNPRGVRVDGSGNLYVADQLNNAIKRISPDGTTTTILSGITQPIGLTLDKRGSLYITNFEGKDIWQMSVSGYTIDKPLPRGLSFDGHTGNISGTPIETTPSTNYTITAYNGAGSSATTLNITVQDAPVGPIMGTRPAINYASPVVFEVNQPVADLLPTNTGGTVPATPYGLTENVASNIGNIGSVAVGASGMLYYTDPANNLVKRVDPSGATPNTTWGSGANAGNDGSAGSASFSAPYSLVADQTGNIYVSDPGNNAVRKISANGNVTTLAGGFNRPKGIEIDATGDFLFLADEGNNVIKKISTFDGTVTTIAAGTLSAPTDICFDEQGYLYILNTGAGQVLKLAPDGTINTFAEGITNAKELQVDGLGDNCYITTSGNLLRVSKSGEEASLTGFFNPSGITLDKSTSQGSLYVSQGNLLKKVCATGYSISPADLPDHLMFDNKTGKINGTPTVLTGSLLIKYTVTAYNLHGSSSAKIEMRIEPAGRVQQKITFPVITPKLVCSPPFPAGASSSNSSLLIQYSSDNTSIAEVDANTGLITLKGPTGTVTITAKQPGNANYLDATPVTQLITVNEPVNPSVKIIDNRAIACIDQPVKFDAEISNLSVLVNPTFQWFHNGQAVASNTLTYSTLVTPTDEIKCIVTNNDECIAVGEAAVTNVNAKPKSSLTLTLTSSTTTAVCQGTEITFTAEPNFDNYQNHYRWKVNGIDVPGDSPTFSSKTLKDGDIVSCSFTNASAPCVISPEATASNPITVSITPPDDPAPQVKIIASANKVYAETPITFTAVTTNTSGSVLYQWLVNGLNTGTNGPTFKTTTLNNADKVSCVIITGNCNPPIISNELFMNILPPVLIEPANVFTPNGDGINDTWQIRGLSAYPNSMVNVFNRQGQNIFQSKGYGTPWDGLHKNKTLPIGTYYYIIDLANGKPKIAGFLTISR